MDVRITYCTLCWGYRDHALALAEDLRRRFGATVEVCEGQLGQFDVEVEGALVASRGESLIARMNPRRPPPARDVIATIEGHLPAGERSSQPIRSTRPRGEFGPEEAKRFYDRFGSKQDAQFYENAALDRLIAWGGFEQARAVFEWGSGTGRLASRLFEEKLSEDARYVGIDISTTMMGLAARRLERWGGRATVVQADGTLRLNWADATFDRFVATYVLDLLPDAGIAQVLHEAHRLLTRDGRLCVVTSTEGAGVISRFVCFAWRRVYALSPRLVGGCRPLRITARLDPSAWHVEKTAVISSWGICSEIAIASPV